MVSQFITLILLANFAWTIKKQSPSIVRISFFFFCFLKKIKLNPPSYGNGKFILDAASFFFLPFFSFSFYLFILCFEPRTFGALLRRKCMRHAPWGLQ